MDELKKKEERGEGSKEEEQEPVCGSFLRLSVFVCGLLLYAMCPCAQWHGGQTHRSLCACPAPVISLIALFMKHSH